MSLLNTVSSIDVDADVNDNSTLGDILARATEALAKPLPLPVQRFCSEIEKNFTITSQALEDTATRLEDAAKELRQRAKELKDASPDVRSHVEKWIQYERESNERGKFLQSLFK